MEPVDYDPMARAHEQQGTTRGTARRWSREADVMRNSPDQWFRVETLTPDEYGRARKTASHIRTGTFTPMRPAGSFEAQWLATDDGYEVCARYVGPPLNDPE